MHYNRNGEEIDMQEWLTLFQLKEYKTVKQETLDNGLMVSTVWLGFDHGTFNNRKLLF